MNFSFLHDLSWKCMEIMNLRVLPRPGPEIVCITDIFHMVWGARFGEFPSFHEFSIISLIFMKLQ